MNEPARIILKNCLKINRKDKVLIITDKKRENIGNKIFNEACKLCEKVLLIKIPVAKHNGEEPPKKVAELMKKFDFIIAPTTCSLTHTKASQNAAKKGVIIATLPGITKGIMEQSINLDYRKLKNYTSKIYELVKKSKKIKITTKSGTSLEFLTKNRKWIEDDGDFTKNKIGNLPAGEVFIAPYEGTCNGILVIDWAKNDNKTYAKKGVVLKIKKGKVVSISDEKCVLGDYFKKIKNAKNIAEFGMGTNYKAKLIGNILQDEKVLGTCHIAFGNNTSIGGKVYSELHFDTILINPTVYIGDKVLMQEGELII